MIGKRSILALVVLAPLVRVAVAQQAPLDGTAELLAELIRVDDSNPPGHENQLDQLLEPRFKALGFEVDIVPTPEPGKSHFFARLRGDGSRRPVLLAAHADTVGVEREKWTVDPFGGVVKEGAVYGRGAIDFKGGIAVFARAVMMLAENHVALARDVVFLSEADEEGGRYNTSWLAQSHWDKMDCEFALNEGGWIIQRDDGRVRYVSISTADKGSTSIVVAAKGTSTHSSMPRPDNAIFTLSKAMAKVAGYEPKIELTPAQKRFFTTLANTSDPPLSDQYRTLVTSSDPAELARADRAISADPLMHALIRNTLAPVLMNAGFRSNVIPGSAEATVNVRTIPGTDLDALVADLRTLVDDPSIEIRRSTSSGSPPPEPSSENTDLFRALVREARAQWPEAEVTPYLFQAATDATPWRSRGVPVYGIYPYPITAEELTRMHGNDERVAIESLRDGTQMIYRTLVEVAGKRGPGSR
jgi:acetylornithine deacetylase/succinyl-diaminopimelate desuccinylase-like protein